MIEGMLGLRKTLTDGRPRTADFTGYLAAMLAKLRPSVHRHHPSQRPDHARHHRRRMPEAIPRTVIRRSSVPRPRGTCSMRPQRARTSRSGVHRCRRHQPQRRVSRAIAGKASRWSMRCGARPRRTCATARHRRRRRYLRASTICASTGRCLSRERGRGRHRHHAGDLRARADTSSERDRHPTLFGTGRWNHVLIDATINRLRPHRFGAQALSATVWPSKADETRRAPGRNWGSRVHRRGSSSFRHSMAQQDAESSSNFKKKTTIIKKNPKIKFLGA